MLQKPLKDRSFPLPSSSESDHYRKKKTKERKGKRVLGPAQSTPSGDRRARGGCGGAMPGEAGSKGGGLFKGTVRWDHLTKTEESPPKRRLCFH